MTGCNQGFTTDSYETNTPPPTINQVDGIEIFPETIIPTLPTVMAEVKIADESNPGNDYDPILEIIVEHARGKLTQLFTLQYHQLVVSGNALQERYSHCPIPHQLYKHFVRL